MIFCNLCSSSDVIIVWKLKVIEIILLILRIILRIHLPKLLQSPSTALPLHHKFRILCRFRERQTRLRKRIFFYLHVTVWFFHPFLIKFKRHTDTFGGPFENYVIIRNIIGWVFGGIWWSLGVWGIGGGGAGRKEYFILSHHNYTALLVANLYLPSAVFHQIWVSDFFLIGMEDRRETLL